MPRRQKDPDRSALTALLWEDHLPRCERVAARVRAAGYLIPAGPVRIIYAGTIDGGVYTGVLGRQHFEYRASPTDPGLDDALYTRYLALLDAAGVPKQEAP
jgi:hypothetical protein